MVPRWHLATAISRLFIYLLRKYRPIASDVLMLLATCIVVATELLTAPF